MRKEITNNVKFGRCDSAKLNIQRHRFTIQGVPNISQKTFLAGLPTEANFIYYKYSMSTFYVPPSVLEMFWK